MKLYYRHAYMSANREIYLVFVYVCVCVLLILFSTSAAVKQNL